ncbi:hypothetical protein ANRL1_02368 [Anaerolineae bacterium]|nr:hypothetical protein ANRL1_02368 [Anaerolineae bacterium]
MNGFRWILAVALLVCSLAYSQTVTTAAGSATITLSPQTRFQTINGWEAVAQAGQIDSPAFSIYKNSLYDQAVNDLGINRLRVEIKSKVVNGDFDFTAFDKDMDLVTVPIKQRVEANGEKLWVNVTVVGDHLENNPTKYGQQVLATYQHMRTKYGFVPDSWEVALEPANFGWGSAAQVSNAMIAASNQLKANGFATYFVVPSSECGVSTAIAYFNSMLQVSGTQPLVNEFAYHRYCWPSDQDLQNVANIGNQYGIKTAMLEHIASDYNDLHKDLKLANISAWEQFTLAYPTGDDGAQYYWIDDSNPNSPIVTMGSRTKLLRQYFKFIRAGAVRINATTTNTSFDPVAFINANGKYVVVVKTTTDGAITIAGLPAGTYGIKYTTGSQYDINLNDKVISAGQSVSTSIPAPGVITIYAKAAGATPTNTPTRTATPTRTPIPGLPRSVFLPSVTR